MSLDPRAVQVDREVAENAIAAFCERHDFPLKDEYTPAEVCEMMAVLHLVCTPYLLQEFVEKKYISPCDSWGPAEIFVLVNALDTRRRWTPTPSIHDHRKSSTRILIEQIRASGVNPPINDLDEVTLEDLLLRLVRSNDPADREALYETIRCKLEGYEE